MKVFTYTGAGICVHAETCATLAVVRATGIDTLLLTATVHFLTLIYICKDTHTPLHTQTHTHTHYVGTLTAHTH